MMNEEKRTGKMHAAGIVLCAFVLAIRLFSEMIGGGFHDFCTAAFPWLMIGLGVAVVLAVQHGKEGDRIEKQNSGIEKEP